MADTTVTRAKLTAEEKSITREAMDAYRQEHPGANLKEVRIGLSHLPFADKITEGVLRGLSARRPGEPGRGGGRKPAGDGRVGRGGTRGAGSRGGRKATLRNRSLEKVIGDLNGLRRQREDLDAQISELEGEVRDRMHETMGADHAGRIFGGLLKGIGDTAQRVGSTVGDTAQRVGTAVGDRISETRGGGLGDSEG